MSLLCVSTLPDQGYDQHFPLFGAIRAKLFNDFPCRRAKRFPCLVIVNHSRPPCHDGDNDGHVILSADEDVLRSERPVPSPVFCEEPMRDLAIELQGAARAAAGPIEPGKGIQAQINQACKNLGYPRGHWRVTKAWYGLAGNWESRATFDFLERYAKFVARRTGIPAPANDVVALSTRIRIGDESRVE